MSSFSGCPSSLSLRSQKHTLFANLSQNVERIRLGSTLCLSSFGRGWQWLSGFLPVWFCSFFCFFSFGGIWKWIQTLVDVALFECCGTLNAMEWLMLHLCKNASRSCDACHDGSGSSSSWSINRHHRHRYDWWTVLHSYSSVSFSSCFMQPNLFLSSVSLVQLR